MTRHRLTPLVALLLTVAFLAPPTAAHAGPLVNGSFSAGLTGWTVSEVGAVTVNGAGEAVVSESLTSFEVVLSQEFTLSATAQTLRFQLRALTTEPDSLGGLPDAMNVALLDPTTLNSVVGTADPLTTAYYTRDLVDGVTVGVIGADVLPGALDPTLPLTIVLNVAPLAGQDVRLEFRLLGGGVDTIASFTVDDVEVTEIVLDVIPEPSGVVLLGCGVGGLLLARARRRAR